jgi:ubiquinone/menaquinone biosynthesis C-methylase UbiE
LEDWESLADWYDKKQGDGGDLWHRTLIDPALLRVMGNVGGKVVLDLGCGNGYLSRVLARMGAKVTAVDDSPRMVKNAQARDPGNSLKIRYLVSDAARLTAVDGSSFDLVFANMSLMDIEDGEGAIKEVSRVLKIGGRFVASISHPCFDNGSNSGWIAAKSTQESPKVFRRIRSYRNPFSENIPWKVAEKERKYTRAFHRPLNWYARVLRSNGMSIVALEEPEPTKELLDNEDPMAAAGFVEVPLHLVVEAIKQQIV